MKARLLYRERDFAWQWALEAAARREAASLNRRYQPHKPFDMYEGFPWNQADLVDDLELDTLLTAMAGEDDLVFEVARRVILTGQANDTETIRHRQACLRDCLDHPSVVREIYDLATEASQVGKKHPFGILTRYPDWLLRRSIELLEELLDIIAKLNRIADRQSGMFASDGWRELFRTIKRDLDVEYCAEVARHLKVLKFEGGVLLSAELGKGGRAEGYVLHRPPQRRLKWLTRMLPHFFPEDPPAFRFSLHPRDEAGARMMQELQAHGIAIAASTLAQSAEHVRNFFHMLRAELAFYVGCINLSEELAPRQVATCLPQPAAAEERRLSANGLIDVCLALTLDEPVVGNDVAADGKDLIIVTGANQGGKSTFLRSLGLAQLMMQCGMQVTARSFSSSLCDALYTHYRREEDAELESGKLDEELGRMDAIVGRMTLHPMILLNESLAATNEREGSEIATQIISAFIERRIRVVCVTHLYQLAHGFYEKNAGEMAFLRAERKSDGTRTFKVFEGAPLQTSFGEDLYNRIFATKPAEEEPAPAERAEAMANGKVPI